MRAVVALCALWVPALAHAGKVEHTCEIDVELAGPALGWVRYEADALAIRQSPVRFRDGALVIPVWTPTGRGGLFLRGHVPVSVTWGPDHSPCDDLGDLSPGPAPEVEGQVALGSSHPKGLYVAVSGCGVTLRADESGRFEGPAVPGTCELRAVASDWRYRWVGAPVSLEVPAAGERVVELELSEQPVSGLGVLLGGDTGREVVLLLAGSAARRAGIEVGDQLVRIDGEALTGREGSGATIGGVLGSRAHVELEREGRALVLDAYRLPINHAFAGTNLGIDLNEVDGLLEVAEVAGPAARVGIAPGEKILAVDGEDASGWTVGRFIGTSRGTGGEVHLVLAAVGGSVREIPVPRERIYP